MLRVDPSQTDLYNVRNGVDNLEPYLQTQVQLITSPNVLTAAGTNPKAAVLERVQKAGDVVQELRKAVTVNVITGTYLIEVSMTSNNGYEAATIVNAVVDAFIEANGEWSDGMTRQQIKTLEQYSTDLKNQTDEIERKWMALAAHGDFEGPIGIGKTDDADPAGKVQDAKRSVVTIEEYRSVRRQVNEVKLELAAAQAWLATARAALARAGADRDPAVEKDMIDKQVERRFNLDPEVLALLDELKQAEAKVADAGRQANQADDPAVVAAKSRQGKLVARYKEMWDSKSQAIRGQIEHGGNALEPDREVREASIAVNKLMAKHAVLKGEVERLDVQNMTQATDHVKTSLLQDERKSLMEMQEAVTRRLEQLKYEAKGEARIRPVNPNGAMVPNRPISDDRALVLPTIPLAMLFVTFVLFVGIEAFAGPSDKADREA